MGTLRVKLREYLDTHQLSAYQLAKEVEGMSPKTVYAYAAGSRQPSIENLEKLITTLRKLTGESVDVSDLLEYQPELAETRAWHDADLSRLGEYEPYDWGDIDPETLGKPLRFEK
ncbi:MAG: helix-turn-helix transcriptional regulator [Deinococcus sp.]|nr:helix-turn-helix transcriptional regulator [Deinococcus sp.]